jgi:hypothetical protein
LLERNARAFWDVFLNGDERETTDSMLLDIRLPYTGPYVIKIGPLDPMCPMNAGAYDLYVYRHSTIPESGAATLLGLMVALDEHDRLEKRPCRNNEAQMPRHWCFFSIDTAPTDPMQTSFFYGVLVDVGFHHHVH